MTPLIDVWQTFSTASMHAPLRQRWRKNLAGSMPWQRTWGVFRTHTLRRRRRNWRGRFTCPALSGPGPRGDNFIVRGSLRHWLRCVRCCCRKVRPPFAAGIFSLAQMRCLGPSQAKRKRRQQTDHSLSDPACDLQLGVVGVWPKATSVVAQATSHPTPGVYRDPCPIRNRSQHRRACRVCGDG